MSKLKQHQPAVFEIIIFKTLNMYCISDCVACVGCGRVQRGERGEPAGEQSPTLPQGIPLLHWFHFPPF